MKKILLSLFAFMLFAACFGKTIPFRSGEVLNAEFTTQKVAIENFNKLLFDMDSARFYASVAIRLSPGRTISIFDYKLNVNNNFYPAVAIQKNYSGFQYTTEKMTPKRDSDIFFLLFFVNTNMSNSSYSLHANFQPIDRAKVLLPFKNLNGQAPQDSTMIKYDGNF